MPRLIPLRVKEGINHMVGRPMFDLSYYLRFQPSSLEHTGVKVKLIPGRPAPATRRRVALVTPHLGPGGAERVLLDICQSFDRTSTELFLIATHSTDSRWSAIWSEHVDHVHDLAARYPPEEIASRLYSIVVNHAMDVVVVQNSLYGYAVIPHWRTALASLHIVDLVHAVGAGWDLASVTASVSDAIDTRIVISEAVRKHLVGLGTAVARIRLIRNGVDLERFRPVAAPDDGVFRILFCARLDPVKRPLMLPTIAAELARLHPSDRFRFIVAGDGPLFPALRERVRADGLEPLFDLRGFVDDVAPWVAASDVLLLTSSNEGIPLTILEAFASARPVIAPDLGAIGESLDSSTGVPLPMSARPADYARALSMLMKAPELRRAMGAAGRRRAEQDHDRRRILELYREILCVGRDVILPQLLHDEP